MKNIEKFPRTNDALEAWRQSVRGGVYLSFDEWAQREYEAPRIYNGGGESKDYEIEFDKGGDGQ